ncbi:MAG: LysM peptidoglycan-binding domain-containing protein [Anaerolineales bacterium]|jgi:tetratricopeptide (TPR) repeat protein
MSANPDTLPQHDPIFRSALQHIQNGDWESGLAELDQLVDSYPMDASLRTLRQEMQFRAQIDEDEQSDAAQTRIQVLKTWALRLGILVVVVVLVAWGVTTYSNWLEEQWASTRETIESEVFSVELAVKFRDAQDLLQANRPDEAYVLLQELQSEDPDYPGLVEIMEQVTQAGALEAKYQEAISLIENDDLSNALIVLNEIAEQEPYYKDVSQQIANLKSRSFLGDIFSQSEMAYAEEKWSEAVSGYETLRALDPQYQSDLVEERLFNAYVNTAQSLIAQDAESIQVLNTAEEYFRKALTLRPQNQEVILQREQARKTVKDRLFNSYVVAAQETLSEQGDSLEALAAAEKNFNKALELYPGDPGVLELRELAHLYLEAIEDFRQGDWNEAIDSLEYIYSEDADYAMGTSRHTLYEAYIARGNSWMVTGEYETALLDYQRAAMIAEKDPVSKLRLFEAQLKVAEAQGALGEYEKAVLIYRNAIDSAELSEEILEERPELVEDMEEADFYADRRNYRRAYLIYSDAAVRVLYIFPRVTHVVQSDDYITRLARQYHTTVDAIYQANEITSSKDIVIGQELVIPTQQ